MAREARCNFVFLFNQPLFDPEELDSFHLGSLCLLLALESLDANHSNF